MTQSKNIEVAFTPGCHGNFLIRVLHYMMGINPIQINDRITYDDHDYGDYTVFGTYNIGCDKKRLIIITIPDDHIPQFVINNINRVSAHDLLLEELHIDTKNKILGHSNLCHLYESLVKIHGDDVLCYSKSTLREWIRLCLLNPSTVRIWNSNSYFDNCRYKLSFADFYNKNNLVKSAAGILHEFHLPIKNQDISDLYDVFRSKLRYDYIMPKINLILEAIINNNDIPIECSNLVEEAAIDRYLENNFGIIPFLNDQYFTTTGQIISAYKLK